MLPPLSLADALKKASYLRKQCHAPMSDAISDAAQYAGVRESDLTDYAMAQGWFIHPAINGCTRDEWFTRIKG